MQDVFLHGLGQTASSWDKTIAVMGNGGRAACPQLTELLRDKPVNYPNLYQGFSEYCAHFSQPLYLCGLSLGGVLALHYGIEHSDRVAGMALIGTQYVMPKGLLRFQNLVFRAMPDRAFREMGFAKRDFISLSKSMMDLDFREDLHRVTCPVLVVCGEKDKANKAASRRLRELLPHAELCMVENAGHEVNVDAPEKLGVLLKDFYGE